MFLSKFEQKFPLIFSVSGFSRFPFFHKIDQYFRIFLTLFMIWSALNGLKAIRLLDSFIFGAIVIWSLILIFHSNFRSFLRRKYVGVKHECFKSQSFWYSILSKLINRLVLNRWKMRTQFFYDHTFHFVTYEFRYYLTPRTLV